MEHIIRNDLKKLKIGIVNNNVKLDDFYTKVLYKKTPEIDKDKCISITECIELIKSSKNKKVISKYNNIISSLNTQSKMPLENLSGSFIDINVDNDEGNEDIGYINNNVNNNDNNNIYDKTVVNSEESHININKYINIEPIQGVRVRMRQDDGYINASELCKAAGKKFNDWSRLDTTKEYLEVLSVETGIPVSGIPETGIPVSGIPETGIPVSGIPETGLIEIKKGGNNKKEQGTWVHPDVAINIANWCSPLFAVKVSNIVKRYYSGDTTLFKEIKQNKEKIFISPYKLTKQELKKMFGNDKRYIYLGKFTHNGKIYYKYGKTNTLHTRMDGLFGVYENFEFVKIWECTKNDYAEKDVSDTYIGNGKKRILQIKNKNREEIIDETEENEEELIFEIDEIVKKRNDEYKTENIKKYSPEITNEITIQEQLKLEQEKEKTTQKYIKLEQEKIRQGGETQKKLSEEETKRILGLKELEYKYNKNTIEINNNEPIIINNVYPYNYDDTYKNKLNKNPYLLGFNNGIYDLETFEFRDGKFEDYVTMKCQYDYNTNEKLIKEVEYIFEQIIPSENVRKYVLKILGFCLIGKNEINDLYIFSEYKNESIRFLMDIIEKVFGEYCDRSNIIDNNIINKRIVILRDIINENETTKISLLEQYKQAKYILLCNKVPIIDINNTNLKIWKKVKNIPLRSNKIPSERILELKKKINDLKVTIINVLIKYYNIYENEGLEDIPEIINETKEYINDFTQEFIDKYIVKDINGKIKWTTLKERIELYYTNKNIIVQDSMSIKQSVIKKIFNNQDSTPIKIDDHSTRGWYGYKLL